MKPIVLASASPRRRELLKLLNVPFESISTDADESRVDGESAPAMVERLSHLKADAAQKHCPDALIIAADTDVELDGIILGKPGDPIEADAMLRSLRCRTHNVFTGFTIADGVARETGLVHSRVLMRNYSDTEIETYIASGDPFDKAAGYAIQHPFFSPVELVEGCVANVMGMPLCRLYHALARHTDLPPPSLNCVSHPETNCSVAYLLKTKPL
jgi:septum formation protein